MATDSTGHLLETLCEAVRSHYFRDDGVMAGIRMGVDAKEEGYWVAVVRRMNTATNAVVVVAAYGTSFERAARKAAKDWLASVEPKFKPVTPLERLAAIVKE